MDVECRKGVAKDGRKFRIAAFRVSCSSRHGTVLYDESTWHEKVELRDWVFMVKMADNSTYFGVSLYNMHGYNTGRSGLLELCNNDNIHILPCRNTGCMIGVIIYSY